MKKMILVIVTLILLAFQVEAAGLNMVNVGAPAINCIYNPACTVVVTDSSGTITLPGTSGSGFLQSRTFIGQPGSPAAGYYAYEYRIDLRNIVGITHRPAITSMEVTFGPVYRGLDYNRDGVEHDQVFVVTSGGMGTVAPSSADRLSSDITFYFNPGVSIGQTSYFFGLTSIHPPKAVTIRLRTSTGAVINIPGRAPNY